MQTMSEQHTAEPWAVADEIFDNDGAPETVITGLDGRAAIAVTLDFGLNNLGMREANARRIVACVNACEGIATHELELMTGALSIHTQITNTLPENLTPKATEYRMQRDELLAFLREIESVTPQDKALWIHTVKCKASALIAKAKEGA